MQFCTRHWEELKAALAAKGFNCGTDADGPAFARRAVNAFCSDPQGRQPMRLATFDPLVAAHNTLLNISVTVNGPEVLFPNADGGLKCVVCYTSDTCNCGVEKCCDKWIGYAADTVKWFYDRLLQEEFADEITV